MSQTTSSGRRIVWQSVITVLSAAVLISAEVFGAAFAGGWALANLMGFGDIGVYVFQVIFFVGGVAVMIAFVRNGMRRRAVHRARIAPQTARANRCGVAA